MTEAVAEPAIAAPSTIESFLDSVELVSRRARARAEFASLVADIVAPPADTRPGQQHTDYELTISAGRTLLQELMADAPAIQKPAEVEPQEQTPEAALPEVASQTEPEPAAAVIPKTKKPKAMRKPVVKMPPVAKPPVDTEELVMNPVIDLDAMFVAAADLPAIEPDLTELQAIEEDESIIIDEVALDPEALLAKAEQPTSFKDAIVERVKEIKAQTNPRTVQSPKGPRWQRPGVYEPLKSANPVFAPVAPVTRASTHLTAENLIVNATDRLFGKTDRLLELAESARFLQTLTKHEELYVMQLQNGDKPAELVGLLLGTDDKATVSNFAEGLLIRIQSYREVRDVVITPPTETSLGMPKVRTMTPLAEARMRSRSRVNVEGDTELFLLDLEDEALEWQAKALCSQTDPEAFFPEKGGSTRDAKKVCTECEVKVECLEYALANQERFGIWGGLSERERRKLHKKAS